ncbi:MAG: cysteine desulfurase [Pirellula sp.]|jgi:cysteine desulfurase|nr:cysteine desulfurase [Pirellula sp.]
MTPKTTITDIYLDNHATTRVDPRVVQEMLPWFDSQFANPGSVSHQPGRYSKEAIDQCFEDISTFLGASRDELIITSGATESTNLAILGSAMHPTQKRRKIVTLTTEHHAVLGPVEKLRRLGWETVLVSPLAHGLDRDADAKAGVIDLDQLSRAIDDRTAIVSVMLANNEIGAVQPLRQISSLCEKFGVLLHTDATQAVGKLPISVQELGVDLLSFSAHKFYGPKGVGGLIVSQNRNVVELSPQIVGGGQQQNYRSGTLNSPGIVGMTAALRLSLDDWEASSTREGVLRNLLWQLLKENIPGLMLNGPIWSDSNQPDSHPIRLPGNLNVCFPLVDGQSLMMELPHLAVSSGSACTAAHPEPSHVLRGIGRSEDQARGSLRFGVGRFNSEAEIRLAAEWISQAYHKLAAFVA